MPARRRHPSRSGGTSVPASRPAKTSGCAVTGASGIVKLRVRRSRSKACSAFTRMSWTSAASSSSGTVTPSFGNEALPTLALRPVNRASSAAVRSTAATMRPATRRASSWDDPGRSTANSSPPWRATKSSPRTATPIASATRRRSSSPAEWPAMSLTCLNRSRSMYRTVKVSPWRRARASSAPARCSKPRRFATPVSGSWRASAWACAVARRTRSRWCWSTSARAVAIDVTRTHSNSRWVSVW